MPEEFEGKQIAVGHKAVWDLIERTLNERGITLALFSDDPNDLPTYIPVPK